MKTYFHKKRLQECPDELYSQQTKSENNQNIHQQDTHQQTVVYSYKYNGIILSNSKSWTTNIGNMDKSHTPYAEWKVGTKEYILYNSIHVKFWNRQN